MNKPKMEKPYTILQHGYSMDFGKTEDGEFIQTLWESMELSKLDHTVAHLRYELQELEKRRIKMHKEKHPDMSKKEINKMFNLRYIENDKTK